MSFWGTRPSPFTSAEVAVLQAIAGTTFTNGQLLIGKGSTGGLAVATLIQGANMTITNGDGTITLAASGGGTGSLTVGTTTIASGTDTRILYDNAGTLGEYTISGSGTVVAMATSPSFTTPTLGVASATSINKVTITAPATSAILTIANGKTLTASVTMTLQGGDASVLSIAASKTLTASNTLTLAGTDGTTMTFPGASDTVAGIGTAQTFTAVQTFTPSARTSGTAAYFTITVPADTAQTAATESIGIKTVTATRTWATTGTVALQREIYLAGVTYASASASQTFTDVTTLYIDKPIAGSNAVFTRAHSLTIVDSTSAASSITGGFVISTTLGTTATSVGIGGGNINAGGTLIVGGHVTLEGVTSTGATGTGKLVFDTSPTFTTDITLSAANIITDTTTGIKIGTATTQKVGFFNSTPIVKPSGDVITALQNLGLVASATVLATTITSRTLWGQTYDGSGNVTGSLTAVGSITGGASNMTIQAGTGASRTLTLQTTSGASAAQSNLVLNADLSSTFGGNISGTGAWTVTGGAGNMTIVSGTGASRTMILQTTTSGSTATTALTLNADQTATFAAGATIGGTLALGANSITMSGSIGVTGTRVTKGWFTDVESTNVPTVGGTALPTLAAGQTWTGQNKFNNIVDVNNAIAASSNAATVPVTFRLNTVTNNSAATLTITMTTTSAVDGQLTIVRILDSSAAAQTITWVNTENSTVTAPTTSNGSTTLFLTVGFIYNSATSKWRCIASA